MAPLLTTGQEHHSDFKSLKIVYLFVNFSTWEDDFWKLTWESTRS